jgi:hypothetical protein
MALNVNRNLPSFSEMRSAMQNKNSLEEAIKSGYQGYLSGAESARKSKETEADIALKSAQAKEALSKANADPMKDYTDIRALAGSLTKEQYDTLAATATPMGDKMMVKKSEVANLIPLVKEQGVERRAELARLEETKARARADERQASLIKSLADRQEKSLRASEERQAKQQALGTAGEVLKEAEKRPPITKATDWLLGTERQKQIKQAQQIRQQALNALQPGETAMVHPTTGEIVAVPPEEIAGAIKQGYQHLSQ